MLQCVHGLVSGFVNDLDWCFAPEAVRLRKSSVLQCVALRCSEVQCVAVCSSLLQCVAVCCSVLQCVAVRCSVL